MSMCAAEAKLAPWGTVYCTKSKGHHGSHHAYDALIDHRWTQDHTAPTTLPHPSDTPST